MLQLYDSMCHQYQSLKYQSCYVVTVNDILSIDVDFNHKYLLAYITSVWHVCGCSV